MAQPPEHSDRFSTSNLLFSCNEETAECLRKTQSERLKALTFMSEGFTANGMLTERRTEKFESFYVRFVTHSIDFCISFCLFNFLI